MNKTININLGGFFFHIDEKAFKKLKNYLDAIEVSLNGTPQEKKEILADIETRISELLSEKLKDERQVVNEIDINDIIIIMGQPEDYADSEETFTSEQKSTSSKKLFRDGDNTILGGVSAGMGHYLGTDKTIIRVLFVLFTIFGGFGIPLYLILWALVPEAKTTAEKLEMQGKAVTIETIEKKIKAEFENVSEKFKNVNYNKTTSQLQKVVTFLGKIFSLAFTVLGKFIGALLILIATLTLLFILFNSFFFETYTLLGSELFPDFFYGSILPNWLITTVFFISIGIPFIILLLLGFQLVSNQVKSFSKPASLTLLGIWIVALLVLTFRTIEHSSTNNTNGYKSYTETLKFSAPDTLRIKMLPNKTIHNMRYTFKSTHKQVARNNNSKEVSSNIIDISLETSDTEKTSITITKNSEGKNEANAIENAEKISYSYKIENNTIALDSYFISKYIQNNENINIVIAIPKGITVFLYNSTKPYLNNLENTSSLPNSKLTKKHLVMTKNGLECTDCIK